MSRWFRSLVLPLHGHLAPAAWAAAQAKPGARVGYVQTGGGALPGSFSRDVATLRERGLLCGHITAGPCLRRRARGAQRPRRPRRRRARPRMGRRDRRPRPGHHRLRHPPRPRRHGGAGHCPRRPLAADADPDLPAPLVRRPPRAPPRRKPPHLTVLEMLLPAESRSRSAEESRESPHELAVAAGWRHRLASSPSTWTAYAASGLPTRTMGRDLSEDPLFFAAASGLRQRPGHMPRSRCDGRPGGPRP